MSDGYVSRVDHNLLSEAVAANMLDQAHEASMRVRKTIEHVFAIKHSQRLKINLE